MRYCRSVVFALTLFAGGSLCRAAEFDATLAPFRAKIDALDGQIIALLNEPATVVRQVGEVKRKAGAPASAPNRAAQVLDAAAARSKGPLDPKAIRRIYAEILTEMTAFEESEMKKASK